MHLGLVPQGRRIFPSLTVDEHLAIASADDRVRLGYPAGSSTLFPRLEERRHHRGNELSGGEQQMLAIGRALVANPAARRHGRADRRPVVRVDRRSSAA